MTTKLMPKQEYVFNAVCYHVVDGDTIDVDIDVGMHIHCIQRLRILRVNAPEIFGHKAKTEKPAGEAARSFVVSWLNGQHLRVQTYRTDDFGRYLAEVWRVSDGHNLSDDLLSSGNAVPDVPDAVAVPLDLQASLKEGKG